MNDMKKKSHASSAKLPRAIELYADLYNRSIEWRDDSRLYHIQICRAAGRDRSLRYVMPASPTAIPTSHACLTIHRDQGDIVMRQLVVPAEMVELRKEGYTVEAIREMLLARHAEDYHQDIGRLCIEVIPKEFSRFLTQVQMIIEKRWY